MLLEWFKHQSAELAERRLQLDCQLASVLLVRSRQALVRRIVITWLVNRSEPNVVVYRLQGVPELAQLKVWFCTLPRGALVITESKEFHKTYTVELRRKDLHAHVEDLIHLLEYWYEKADRWDCIAFPDD
jgi:hypothetical protein